MLNGFVVKVDWRKVIERVRSIHDAQLDASTGKLVCWGRVMFGDYMRYCGALCEVNSEHRKHANVGWQQRSTSSNEYPCCKQLQNEPRRLHDTAVGNMRSTEAKQQTGFT